MEGVCVSVRGCEVVGSLPEEEPDEEEEEEEEEEEVLEEKERGVSGVMSPYAITRARSW